VEKKQNSSDLADMLDIAYLGAIIAVPLVCIGIEYFVLYYLVEHYKF